MFTSDDILTVSYSREVLGMCYTDPQYRRRGAATMLLDWGIQKADELGVEIFFDSTPWAVPFYIKAGFVKIDDVFLDMHMDDPSEEWREWEKRILPYGW